MRSIEHWLATGLGWFTKGWFWIALVAVVTVVGGLWIGVKAHVEHDQQMATDNAELTADLEEEQRKAREAQAEFDRQLAQERRDAGVALAGAVQEARRAGYYAALRQRINDAPDEADGPVAPVLRDALRGVRDDLRGYTEPVDSLS